MNPKWVIVGAGVQGRQIGAAVAAVVKAEGGSLLGFLDDDPSSQGETLAGLPILGSTDWLRDHTEPVNVAVALGNPSTKRKVVARLRALGDHIAFPPVIHPFSCVGPDVILGEGVVVQAGAVLLCDLWVGEFTVVGACSSISHNAHVGAYCFLSPGLRVAGFGTIEDDCETGLNTCLVGHKTLKKGSATSMGAIIHKDVPEDTLVLAVQTQTFKARRPAE